MKYKYYLRDTKSPRNLENNSAGEMDHSSASGDAASAAPAAAEGENIMVSGDAGSTIAMPIPLPIQTVMQIPPPRQGESQSKLPQILHPIMMAMPVPPELIGHRNRKPSFLLNPEFRWARERSRRW